MTDEKYEATHSLLAYAVKSVRYDLYGGARPSSPFKLTEAEAILRAFEAEQPKATAATDTRTETAPVSGEEGKGPE